MNRAVTVALIAAIIISQESIVVATAAENSEGSTNIGIGTPPLTDCDTYASSPSDPNHLGGGVDGGKIETAKAIEACQATLQQYPNTARFQFQLGRSYDANKQYDLGVQAYKLAAAQNYRPLNSLLIRQQKLERG